MERNKMIDALMYKGCDIILAIENNDNLDYMQKVEKATSITYSYITHVIKIFEKEKLATTKKEGRKREIKLTETGREIKKNLEIIYGVLKTNGG